MKNRFITTLGALFICVLLAACGGNEGNGTNDGAGTNNSATEETADGGLSSAEERALIEFAGALSQKVIDFIDIEDAGEQEKYLANLATWVETQKSKFDEYAFTEEHIETITNDIGALRGSLAENSSEEKAERFFAILDPLVTSLQE